MTQDLHIGWLHLSPPRDACFVRHVYSLQQQNSYNSQIILIISLTKKEYTFHGGLGQLSQYSDLPWAGWSGD